MSIAQEIARQAFPEESRERHLRSGPIYNRLKWVVFPVFSKFGIRCIQVKEIGIGQFGYRHERVPNGTWHRIHDLPDDTTIETLDESFTSYEFVVTPAYDVSSGDISSLYVSLPPNF